MTRGIVGLVPVRGFETGKTRLAGELSLDERISIMQWMLRGVMTAALSAGRLAELAVISPDPGVLAYALAIDERVIPILQRDNAPGLNPAVTIGRDWAVQREAAGLLVLFADLPLVTADDVRAIVREPVQMVIATDRHGHGTNASLVRFEGRGREFVYHYGADSARRHTSEADRLGLSLSNLRRPGTAFDLDTPEDWRTLSGLQATGPRRHRGQPDVAIDAAGEAVGAGERG